MNKIIGLTQASDYEGYNPVLILREDLDFDNRFCVICTNEGNVAFSYYDLGIMPNYIIQGTVLFLGFGKGYYIIDLKEKNIICESNDTLSVIFEIIKLDVQSCVIFIGEISLICFSLEGEKLWENNYRNTIFNWSVSDETISVVFDNNDKWIILLKDGNGIHIN